MLLEEKVNCSFPLYKFGTVFVLHHNKIYYMNYFIITTYNGLTNAEVKIKLVSFIPVNLNGS
jgi:hypothetical protein